MIASTAMVTLNLFANQQSSMDVSCPTGKRVLGGGWETNNPSANVHALSSYPLTQSSWRVVIRLSQPDAATFGFRVWAVCATAN